VIAVMSSAGETDHPSSRPSVFISYASEDRPAASSIRDSLAAAGLEVWYDENELGGGDAWDRKIRQQIRECDYFMPLISARTEARHEGYFRREWRLAVERTLDMADDHTFLLPIAIDATDQATARVPERFLTVQWLRVPNGQPTPALTALCTRLVSGDSPGKPPPKRVPIGAGGRRPAPAARALPPFPIHEPGQAVKFWVHVAGWAISSAWIYFKRLPRWIRLIIYIWLFLILLSRGCSHRSTTSGTMSPEAAQKLKVIADKYQGSSNKSDVAKLGIDIAREISKEVGDSATSTLLVIPFLAPADNPEDAKLANSTFAILYGRLAISHQGQVGLSKEPLQSLDIGGAVDRGHGSHSSFVLFGGIENQGAARVLTVEIVTVSDRSVAWSKSYSIANADPETIASEIEAHIPSLDDN
jgi:hypothetical protein